jgi:hypothetical protein
VEVSRFNVLKEFDDKSMQVIVLAETDEVPKTNINFSMSILQFLFHIFFMLFVGVKLRL